MKVLYDSYLRRNRNNNNNNGQHHHHQQQPQQQQQQQQTSAAKLEICHPNDFAQQRDHGLEPNANNSPYLITFDSLQLNKELGVGEFGVVKQGVWTNHQGRCTQVAIKCLSPSRLENSKEDFFKEASIMHGISHEHIVQLYGVVLNPSIMLVTELAPLRSLLECLKEPSLVMSFPVSSLCTFAAQIADGMSYLESRRLIHRDLAARNILVYNKNMVKISDFGLSRALGVGKDYYQSNFNVNLKLPIAWCAPECINYLKFTSQSDVWAYGVTLWEMFSFGFQPWAALTGQQILQAIDQPNFQRLEQPECCPKEYYQLMLKCWAHDERARPKFCEIVKMQSDLKPELLQAIRASGDGAKRIECLKYKAGDIITVLDKKVLELSDNSIESFYWKGVTNDRKTGYFSPSDFVAYLGLNLPSTSISSSSTATSSNSFVQQLLSGGGSSNGHNGNNNNNTSNGNHSSSHHHRIASTITSTVLQSSKFLRGFLESKSSGGANAVNSSPHGSRKTKLRPEMISKPQGDLKHTGHIGADGVYFGNVAFIESKQQQQQQQTSMSELSVENKSKARLPPPLSNPLGQFSSKSSIDCSSNDRFEMNHEYLEIGDEEDLKPLESPTLETMDMGPSLMEEVLRELNKNYVKPDLGTETGELEAAINENGINVKNEMKELNFKLSKDATGTNSRKKPLAMKEISDAEKNELDSAIALAKDLATRTTTMMDGEHHEESPKTPNSPNKRMFSFKLPHHHKSSPKGVRKTFSEETESIGDIIESITPAAKEAYISLVNKGVASCTGNNNNNTEASGGIKRPEVKPPAPPTTSSSVLPLAPPPPPAAATEPVCESNPLRMLRSTGIESVLRPKIRGNRSFSQPRLPTTAQTAGLARVASSRPQLGDYEMAAGGNGHNGNNNALPLPPRDRTRPMIHLKTHQRRHPLMIPAEMIGSSDNGADGAMHLGGPDGCRGGGLDASPPLVHRPFPVLKSDDLAESFESEIQKAFDNIKLNNEKKVAAVVTEEEVVVDDTTTSMITTKPIEEDVVANNNNYDIYPLPSSTTLVAHNTNGSMPIEQVSNITINNNNNIQQPESAPPTNGVKHTLKNSFNEGQVAVMQNVLTTGNNQVHIPDEECTRLLNSTDYDVNKAIKIVRLRQELALHNIQVDCDLVAMLDRFHWDRRQVANYLIATQGGQAETTEV